MLSLQQLLAGRIRGALEAALAAGQIGQLTPDQLDAFAALDKIVVQPPRQAELGDYATPVAMALAKPARVNPLGIAEAVADQLHSPDYTVEVAKPGYINFRLSSRFICERLTLIGQQKADYGRTTPDVSERVLVEYVSANPTGPLHLGHGRWAAVGSTLVRLLEFAGYEVGSEFYINDAGNQMQLLGESLRTRYLQALGAPVEMPPNGYQGKDIQEIAAQLVTEKGDTLRDASIAVFSAYAEEQELARQRETLAQFRTEFERWYSERALRARGAVEAALEELDGRGMLYRASRSRQEESGAFTGRSSKVQAHAFEEEGGGGETVYFKAADFGDEMDRVVVKADGNFTYLASDIAYHRDKYERGYDRLINLWGADHHGYVPRMKAAVQALGRPADSLEILVGQMVRLFRENPETGQKEEMRMSKRTGDLVSVDDLIEEVGVDAARWYLLGQSLNSTISFDLDLAATEKFDNPVFYVQYSHARCCSILRKAPERGMPIPEHYDFLKPDGKPWCTTPQEQALMRRLVAAPDEYRLAALDRAPQRLTQYAYDLAGDMAQFYEHCPTLPPLAENLEPGLRYARLGLVDATRQVLANTLGLLGIEPRDSM